jgi:hypothetical protein
VKKLWTMMLLAMPVVLLASQGCGGGDEKGFMEACVASDECPSGWVCPDPDESGNGAVGRVCTPVCEEDADCKAILGRTDVNCVNDFCTQNCDSHDDCPADQNVCRGANPTCEGESLGQLWCATEDFSCF